MMGQAPSFLENKELRFLLLGGKGGVGKTTVAAAAALYRAAREPDRNILAVSTDPAHSLSDSLDQAVGNEITPITVFSNLFALEMDAGEQLEAFKEEQGDVLKTIADRGTFFDEEDIATFFELSLPGLDELMAVIEVADIVKEGRYDLVILDTAPTGHTLRLLALPRLMEDWIRVLELMLDKHRYMVSVFGRYRPDETDAFLETMSSDLNRLRRLLSDSKATEFVPVTIPEAMSIEETGRLLENLARLAIPVRNLVVNRVAIQNECPFCRTRRQSQERHLNQIEQRFSDHHLVRIPLLRHDVRGQEALQRYAQGMASIPTAGRANTPSAPQPLSSPAPPLLRSTRGRTVTLYLLAFAGALVLAIGATPVARYLAPRMGMVDQPEARKIHDHPVPRLGGAAILMAVVIAALVLGERYKFEQFGTIIVGAAGVSFMGLIDDRWGLNAFVKLGGQIAAALLLYVSGINVSTFHNPIISLLVTVFWVVYITNAINLLDNMDGLAGGVSAIAAAHFALMCSFSGQYLVGALSIALLGACLGFLRYNVNPAHIFMGDSGSLFLGFMLAATGIKLSFPENVTFVAWMVPVLVMGVPIFDTALVIVSRLRRGLNPLTSPGRDHVSHRLVAAGMRRREAVLTICLASFVLGLLAIFVTRASVVEGYIGGGTAALVGLYGLWRLERPPFWPPEM